jgi:hypothetical protein
LSGVEAEYANRFSITFRDFVAFEVDEPENRHQQALGRQVRAAAQKNMHAAKAINLTVAYMGITALVTSTGSLFVTTYCCALGISLCGICMSLFGKQARRCGRQ